MDTIRIREHSHKGSEKMKAEIIAVGTELLLGQVVNTNATFLSEELAALGIDVYYHSVVGDNPTRLEGLLQLADSRSDLIVLCGGLGPTTDDLTKQVVAAHVGQELVQDPEGYQNLVTFIKRRNRVMTENNLLQTLVFKDGQALKNSTGLAVGIFYTSEQGTHYLLLPGPPNELKPMVFNEVIPLLQTAFQQEEKLISRVLRFYGIGESQLVTDLADLIEQQTNPTIAPYAKPNEVTIRLTVKTADVVSGEEQLDKLETIIQTRVGRYFYGYGDENSLAQVVVQLLKEKTKTLAVAETFSAGSLQATLGSIPDVTSVLRGGFIALDKGTLAQILAMDAKALDAYGIISQQCVETMALKAQTILNTDYALAITGVVGLEESEGQSVGTVWIALATLEGVSSQCYQFTRDSNYVRHSAVMQALGTLRRSLLIEE